VEPTQVLTHVISEAKSWSSDYKGSARRQCVIVIDEVTPDRPSGITVTDTMMGYKYEYRIDSGIREKRHSHERPLKGRERLSRVVDNRERERFKSQSTTSWQIAHANGIAMGILELILNTEVRSPGVIVIGMASKQLMAMRQRAVSPRKYCQIRHFAETQRD
jgi:hypothetical protein